MVHIPYKGANISLTELVGGQVSVMFAALGSIHNDYVLKFEEMANLVRDNKWIADPESAVTVSNPFGGINCCVTVR